MLFYLGTPEPSWLWRGFRLPLFVSRNRLARLATVRRAHTPWALDSGGFTEIARHGTWRVPAEVYLRDVARYDQEIGCLEWAAPQDWMVEPAMLARTGLSVVEHQARTVESVLALREGWSQHSDDTCPIMPVLQGWTTDDYLACIERYHTAGVALAAEPLVGLGSVCRRQGTREIGDIIAAVSSAVPGIALHGFGVKAGGLARYGHLLASADSQAWSRNARHRDVRSPDCRHAGPCTWCPGYALAWRDAVLGAVRCQRTLARIEPVPARARSTAHTAATPRVRAVRRPVAEQLALWEMVA